MDYLPAEVLEAPANSEVNAAVIWMHGLGADGNDFVPVVPQLGLSAAYGIRFVFPHAPAMPVSINNGFVMPAWYDIKSLSVERSIDEQQLQISVRRIQDLIDREVERGVDPSRIVLAGFSQGGAVAYEAALSYPRSLAGIVALSTYFPTAESLQFNVQQANIPVLVCHGSRDPVVPEMLGQRALEALKGLGLEPDYRSYPMEHAVCLEEIADIGAFLRQILD